MKKFAITIAALSLSAGVAFAENPNVSNPNVLQSGPLAGQRSAQQIRQTPEHDEQAPALRE